MQKSEPLDDVRGFLNKCEQPSELALVLVWMSKRLKELIEKGPPHDFEMPEEMNRAFKLIQAGGKILEDIGKSTQL